MTIINATQFVDSSVDTYTVVINESLEMIESAEAMAIFVYLCTKPKNWTPHPKEIQSRFKFGRDKWLRISKELKDYGLISETKQRNEAGQVVGTTLHLHRKSIKNNHLNRGTDFPTVGKPDPLVNTETNNKYSDKNHGVSSVPESPKHHGLADANDAMQKVKKPTTKLSFVSKDEYPAVWAYVKAAQIVSEEHGYITLKDDSHHAETLIIANGELESNFGDNAHDVEYMRRAILAGKEEGICGAELTLASLTLAFLEKYGKRKDERLSDLLDAINRNGGFKAEELPF